MSIERGTIDGEEEAISRSTNNIPDHTASLCLSDWLTEFSFERSVRVVKEEKKK